MGPVAVGQSTSGPVADQPAASAARPAPRSLAEAGRRSSGERTRTPKSRTRTCCVANYTTPERARGMVAGPALGSHPVRERHGSRRPPRRSALVAISATRAEHLLLKQRRGRHGRPTGEPADLAAEAQQAAVPDEPRQADAGRLAQHPLPLCPSLYGAGAGGRGVRVEAQLTGGLALAASGRGRTPRERFPTHGCAGCGRWRRATPRSRSPGPRAGWPSPARPGT